METLVFITLDPTGFFSTLRILTEIPVQMMGSRQGGRRYNWWISLLPLVSPKVKRNLHDIHNNINWSLFFLLRASILFRKKQMAASDADKRNIKNDECFLLGAPDLWRRFPPSISRRRRRHVRDVAAAVLTVCVTPPPSRTRWLN